MSKSKALPFLFVARLNPKFAEQQITGYKPRVWSGSCTEGSRTARPFGRRLECESVQDYKRDTGDRETVRLPLIPGGQLNVKGKRICPLFKGNKLALASWGKGYAPYSKGTN